MATAISIRLFLELYSQGFEQRKPLNRGSQGPNDYGFATILSGDLVRVLYPEFRFSLFMDYHSNVYHDCSQKGGLLDPVR